MKRTAHNLAAFSESRARAAGLRRGFTLVEVMVAIAIALALIVGISEIFAMAQKTTGGGTALLKNNATERSIQSQMRADFQSINLDTTTAPGLVITSYSVAAFRNKQDQLESRDISLPPDPRNFNNPGSGTPVMNTSVGQFPNGAYSTNGRIHRQDRLCMFVSNAFQRQTADAPNLTSQTTAQEGFVWYGHLALLNDSGISSFKSDDTSNPSGQGAAYLNPGVQSVPGGLQNSNNEYASSWVLGRRAIPLIPSNSRTSDSETAYRPFQNSETPLSMVGSFPSHSYKGPSGPTSTSSPIYSSRYDLSLSSSSECLSAYRKLTASDLPWFEQVSGLNCNLNTGAIIADIRCQANPFPTKLAAVNYQPGQFLSAAAALTAPVFVRGCTQFIVEFAGNYVTQNQDSTKNNPDFGRVTDAKADPSGKLDFIPIVDANGNWTRQIRWYGFPRDTAAVIDPTSPDPVKRIPAPGQDGRILGAQDSNYITYDVVPVSMFRSAAGFTRVPTTFERNATAFQPFQSAFTNGGMNVGSSFPFSNVNHSNPLLPIISTPYICAWDSTNSADLPKLIRITIAIDEPNGRLNTEQTFEYIFELPNQ